MYGQPGELFFHYTTRDAALGHVLPEGRLRMSPYFRMRDPLEAYNWHLGAAYWVENESTHGAAEQAFSIGQQLTAKVKRETKLLSLTIDATSYTGEAEIFGRGWARARMWEQYAERNQGVCLAFDKEALHATLVEQLTARPPRVYWGAVTYLSSGLLEHPAAAMLPIEEMIKAVDREGRCKPLQPISSGSATSCSS